MSIHAMLDIIWWSMLAWLCIRELKRTRRGPPDVCAKHRVRYMRAKPMLPRKWDTDQ